MRLRPVSEADAETAAALVIAGDLADIGEVDYSLEDLRHEWSAIDLATDAVIVEDDAGTAIGYAHFRGTDVLASVHPEREGEGAGTAIAAWAERRGRELALPYLRQGVGDRNPRCRALLEAAGYVRTRSYWRMQREVSADEDPGPAPEGFVLRPFRDADEAAVHAIRERAFSVLPDYDPQTLEEFTQRQLYAHGFDAALTRVAERDGAPAGFATALRWAAGVVFIPTLAVHPDAAGRGLGAALLRGVFAAAGAAGLRRVELSVASDNPNAVRLYERVGMSQRWRIDAYELALAD